MLFRRWDPGSQGIKRNRSDLYHNDKIGRIRGRNGTMAIRVILVRRMILWVGANTGSEGSVSSLGSSKWMRKCMIFVIIKTRFFSLDKEIMHKFKTEDKIERRWVIFGFADLINSTSSLTMFSSGFMFYLFLVVVSIWVVTHTRF